MTRPTVAALPDQPDLLEEAETRLREQLQARSAGYGYRGERGRKARVDFLKLTNLMLGAKP